MARSNNGSAAYGENSASFEQSFARLQEVVQKLSEGNLTLQQALAAFEEGMRLADSCAQMLDEAELRVKQVSERAMRAGSASIIELDQAMRAAPTDDEEPELLSFEIETFESTIVFDQGPGVRGEGSGIRGQGSESQDRRGRNGNPGAENPKSKIQNPKSLDPLFDEDD